MNTPASACGTPPGEPMAPGDMPDEAEAGCFQPTPEEAEAWRHLMTPEEAEAAGVLMTVEELRAIKSGTHPEPCFPPLEAPPLDPIA